jgi:hypothetical protein
MHTRRLAAFLLGGWILGILIFTFVSNQSFLNVDRVLTNPPGPAAKDIEDLGQDIARLLMRYQASELNRFFLEVWGVAQIGIGLAVLSAAVFTAHRSKFIMSATAGMILIALFQVTYIAPSMAAIGRSFDFLPPAAAPREREIFASYHVMYSTAEMLKLILGFLLSARLLFDRYGWKQKFLPVAPKRLERKRKTGVGGRASGTDGVVSRRSSSRTGTSEVDSGTKTEVKTVDHPDDSHVDG